MLPRESPRTALTPEWQQDHAVLPHLLSRQDERLGVPGTVPLCAGWRACSVTLHAAGDTCRVISGSRSASVGTLVPCCPSWPEVLLTISLVDWIASFPIASRASTSSARRVWERFARAGVMSTSWRSSTARSGVPSLQGSGPCTWVAVPRLYFTMWLICAGRSLSSLPRGFEVVEVGRVRAGAQAYLGPRPGVGSPAGDMMVDGVLFPLGEALRPLGLWRPSTRTWRQQHAGSRPRCIGDIQALRAREVSRRRERLVSEFSKCVVAAFEQLASKRQARAVTAEPLGGLPVVVAVRRPWTPGGLGGLV